MAMVECDVVIVGAGPAGCATALALLGAGVERIVLIDKPKRGWLRIGESAAPDVANKLHLLGAATDLADRGHKPYQANLSRWGGQRRYGDFIQRATGHGWHLDRTRFDQDLRDQAVERGARLFCPAKLENLACESGRWQLKVEKLKQQQTEKIHCRYLVDASGRQSVLARRLGAKRKRLDRLTALAWTVVNGAALRGISMVESCADGWWYATCLPEGHGLIALMSDADLIRKHTRSPNDALLQLWQHSCELKNWLPPTDTGDPVAFPAHSSYSTQAVGPGWIAVGDALAAFDPLACAGIANALGDALAAKPVILGWLQHQSLEPAQTYADRADSSLKRYLLEWRLQYSRETQWLDQPFWQRRYGGGLGGGSYLGRHPGGVGSE